MRMRRTSLLLALMTVVASLALASGADARAVTRTYSVTSRPFHMSAFSVNLPKVSIPHPKVDGFIRFMTVHLVYANGRRVSIRRTMLHHIVFLNDGSHYGAKKGSCYGRYGEPFYGTGEEHEDLMLPAGYGYPIHATDKWRMQTMLMSHSLKNIDVRVRYTIKVVSGAKLRRVVPYWIRANGCSTVSPSYTVFGGGKKGSRSNRIYRWKVPISGHIVAAGGHLHGGAKNMFLTQPGCGNRRLLDTRPLYGDPHDLVYRVRPILHEPGPIGTRYFESEAGIGVRKGSTLRLVGAYDDHHPRARVMAIMHVYIAPGPAPKRACAPLPADRREVLLRHHGTTTAPYVRVPLNMLMGDGRVRAVADLPGPTRAFGARGGTVSLGLFRFTPRKISIEAGAPLTWRFDDKVAHNVLYASGPAVAGTGTFSRGAHHTVRLQKPGTYQFFCYLHPVTMQQEVVVTAR